MRKSTAFRCIAVAVITGACSAASAIPPLTEADITAIRKGNQEFVDASIANDRARSLALRTNDVVWYPPGGPAVSGLDSVTKFAATFPPTIRFAVHETEIAGDGKVAYNRGTWAGTYAVGKDTVSDAGKYVQIWRRQADGAWRIAVEIWNSDTPPPPPPAPPARR